MIPIILALAFMATSFVLGRRYGIAQSSERAGLVLGVTNSCRIVVEIRFPDETVREWKASGKLSAQIAEAVLDRSTIEEDR